MPSFCTLRDCGAFRLKQRTNCVRGTPKIYPFFEPTASSAPYVHATCIVLVLPLPIHTLMLSSTHVPEILKRCMHNPPSSRCGGASPVYRFEYGNVLTVLAQTPTPVNVRPAPLHNHNGCRSPIKTSDILAAIDPRLVGKFNDSLTLQWPLYDKAVELWGIRCRDVLPTKKHRDMCVVPPPVPLY